MYICILARDENVEEVREKAKNNVPEVSKHPQILQIPLSRTGLKPITHWFCTFKISPGLYERLISIRDLTEMDIANPKTFLNDRGLKFVDRLKPIKEDEDE